jgi:hypothetical protein
MGVLVKVVDAVGIEKRGPPLDAVDLISFFEQEFGQVCPVLSCDTCNERFFCHVFSLSSENSRIPSIYMKSLMLYVRSSIKVTALKEMF